VLFSHATGGFDATNSDHQAALVTALCSILEGSLQPRLAEACIEFFAEEARSGCSGWFDWLSSQALADYGIAAFAVSD
jgi:hypothetical protein